MLHTEAIGALILRKILDDQKKIPNGMNIYDSNHNEYISYTGGR